MNDYHSKLLLNHQLWFSSSTFFFTFFFLLVGANSSWVFLIFLYRWIFTFHFIAFWSFSSMHTDLWYLTRETCDRISSRAGLCCRWMSRWGGDFAACSPVRRGRDNEIWIFYVIEFRSEWENLNWIYSSKHSLTLINSFILSSSGVDSFVSNCFRMLFNRSTSLSSSFT